MCGGKEQANRNVRNVLLYVLDCCRGFHKKWKLSHYLEIKHIFRSNSRFLRAHKAQPAKKDKKERKKKKEKQK